MKNAVGREIPEELLAGGKEVYQGKYYMDGKTFHKAGPRAYRAEKPQASKVLASIREACEKCGAHDGMTVSFHHAFRNGDYVTSMVVKVLVEEMGLKDLTVATTSLRICSQTISRKERSSGFSPPACAGESVKSSPRASSRRRRSSAVTAADRVRSRRENLPLTSHSLRHLLRMITEMQTVQAERITAARSVMPSQTRAMQIVLSS